MMWKGLGVALNTPSPIVVVLRSAEPSQATSCHPLTLAEADWGAHVSRSESMEPAIQVRPLPSARAPSGSSRSSLTTRFVSQRGDLLFLSMPRHSPLEIGDIVVYQMADQPIPIVHRVVERHDT